MIAAHDAQCMPVMERMVFIESERIYDSPASSVDYAEASDAKMTKANPGVAPAGAETDACR